MFGKDQPPSTRYLVKSEPTYRKQYGLDNGDIKRKTISMWNSKLMWISSTG